MASILPRWSKQDLATLQRMKRVQHKSWDEIADHFDRWVWAVQARLAIIEGRRTSNGGKKKKAVSAYVQPFETPPRRANDDALHLRLILEALRAA